MAIPKAYQAQIKTDVMSGDRNNVAPKMLKQKGRPLINLSKKRKYLWFGLIYMLFFGVIKWGTIIEKWETNAYKIALPGVSFSVGKKAGASTPSTENPVKEKSAPEKSVADKSGFEKSSLPEGAANDAEKRLEPNEKLNSATTSVGDSAGKTSPDIAANAAAKTQNVVTLETDGAGFDPLSTSSPKEVELLLKLAARRQDIEKKEALLKERELAVSVVEKQQKDKIAELTKLKESIEALLKKTDKNSQEHFANLIKVYEGMKPKHAAQIFDKMDVSILKDLVPLMSQRKVSTILDQMNVTKAKELSLVLIGDKNPFAKSAANTPKK